MVGKLSGKLRLELSPTERYIIAADENSGISRGPVQEMTVSFDPIVMQLGLLAMSSVLCELIIKTLTLAEM